MIRFIWIRLYGINNLMSFSEKIILVELLRSRNSTRCHSTPRHATPPIVPITAIAAIPFPKLYLDIFCKSLSIWMHIYRQLSKFSIALTGASEPNFFPVCVEASGFPRRGTVFISAISHKFHRMYLYQSTMDTQGLIIPKRMWI